MKAEKIFSIIVVLIVSWFIIVGNASIDGAFNFFADTGRPDRGSEQRVVAWSSQEEPVKSSESDQSVARKRRLTVLATAYYGPLPNQSSYATGSYRGDIRMNGTGITKSGEDVRIGHIAADWDVLPQGTEVYVPGYGDAVVEDIGGAIQGKKIDLFMGHGQEGLERALEWGRRTVTITVQN